MDEVQSLYEKKVDAMMSKVVLVKRAAAEALAFLVKDDKVRATQ